MHFFEASTRFFLLKWSQLRRIKPPSACVYTLKAYLLMLMAEHSSASKVLFVGELMH
jgi:hypothetical protein